MIKISVIFFPIILFTALSSAYPAPKIPTAICVHNTTGAIALRAKCKRDETKLSNRTSLVGSQGPAGMNGSNGAVGPIGADGPAGSNGLDGTDGTLRVYGNGSAGARVISSSTILSGLNYQYTDFTVDLGAVLTVASGTVIRCTGSFTNNGTIAVATYAGGAYIGGAGSQGTSPSLTPASVGIALSAGGQGAFGNSSGDLLGAVSGFDLDPSHLQNILKPGVMGGSGGGAAFSGLGGGTGGGTFTVLAQGAINNFGTIQANGGSAGFGGGGGGGGIVILASRTLTKNSGSAVISVIGGDGSPSNATNGAGGGGGGGFVHLISPTAPVNSGTITALGGTAGSNSVSVTTSPRIAGPSGGSCAGGGGAGSNVSSVNVSSGNSNGANGPAAILTTADPTSLL